MILYLQRALRGPAVPVRLAAGRLSLVQETEVRILDREHKQCRKALLLMVNTVSIVEAVGASGLFTVVFSFWATKRAERNTNKVESRSARREPEILRGLELDNAARVNELLRQGLDEVEDSRKRQTSEFREIKASLEDKVASLTNENTRLQADLLYERNESKHQMELLKQELAKLHKGMQRLEEGSSDS